MPADPIIKTSIGLQSISWMTEMPHSSPKVETMKKLSEYFNNFVAQKIDFRSINSSVLTTC